MSAAHLAILLPLLAALPLGRFGSPGTGAIAHLVIAVIVLLLTIAAIKSPGSGFIHADPAGLVFGIATGLITVTAAIQTLASATQAGSPPARRHHLARCQLTTAATLLGLYADNTGLLWLAIAAAAIATKPAPATRTAAWNRQLAGCLGLLLALFGTWLIYLAAQPAFGPGLPALSLAALASHATQLDGNLLTLGFLCLLVGYGLNAVAAGPMVNVALIAILRIAHLLAANTAAKAGAMPPGPFLLALGLACILLPAFALWRRGRLARVFNLSATMQAGIAMFAFGIGGAAAIFAGLLNMLLHTLLKPALAVPPGPSRSAAAWLPAAGLLALTGLPPSGLFVPEFLLIGQTIRRDPALSLPLGLGLLAGAIALIRHIARPQAGPPPAGFGTTTIILPCLHLAATLAIAYVMPPVLVTTLSTIATFLQ